MNNESGIMNNELGSGNPSISLRKNNVSEIMNYDFIIMYLNRLSDFLFTLTKWMNKQSNYEETLWKGS
jgi:cob(I)alamin adenosyltransferase